MFKFNLLAFSLSILLLVTEIAIVIFLKEGFIRHTFGDYLVVILLYNLIRTFLFIKNNHIAHITLLIAFIIEFIQLTPFLKLLSLEHHKLANLILGNTFSVSDLMAYTLGYLTILFFNSAIYANLIHQTKHRS